MTQSSVASAPRFRDLRAARRFLREHGVLATAGHARNIALLRIHRAIYDRSLQAGLPHAVFRQEQVARMTLRTADRAEGAAANPLSPVPCKTFDWAMAGLQRDLRDFHFVDIGSGVGYALLLAARQPFRTLTGVEFVGELHEQACDNIRWLTSQGRIGCPVDLRFESALDYRLPKGPCLLFLFCPFDARVMTHFVQRIAEQARLARHPVIAVYVNPSHAEEFARPGIEELPLTRAARWRLRLFSPYDVRAFAFANGAGLKKGRPSRPPLR